MSALGVTSADNLKPFQQCRGGKHKLCTYGAGMAKYRWAGTPSYGKTTDLSSLQTTDLFPEVASLPPLDPKKPDALEGYALAGSIFSSPVPESHRKADIAFITPAAAAENIWY